MNELKKAKRIVIKIGSSLIINQNNGKIRLNWLNSLIQDIMELRKEDKEIIIVTSGAVALGRGSLNLAKSKLKLEEKQAAAACGQIELVRHYKKCFSKYNTEVAQILLTIEDSENRKRYVNSRNTLETLLKMNVIPIINENDTVATHELKFGDNDTLSARVSQMLDADILILFSDIDGLYTANPHLDQNARFLEKVEFIDEKIEKMAGGARSSVGSGGMITKIKAAKIATESGCHMIIALGKNNNPLKELLNTNRATLFFAQTSPLSAKKNWLSSNLNLCGDIVINENAKKALAAGSSLLPIGVIGVKGDFTKGDIIRIIDEHNIEIARGITTYSSHDIKISMGLKSSEVKKLLSDKPDEIIHRNYMIVKHE